MNVQHSQPQRPARLLEEPCDSMATYPTASSIGAAVRGVGAGPLAVTPALHPIHCPWVAGSAGPTLPLRPRPVRPRATPTGPQLVERLNPTQAQNRERLPTLRPAGGVSRPIARRMSASPLRCILNAFHSTSPIASSLCIDLAGQTAAPVNQGLRLQSATLKPPGGRLHASLGIDSLRRLERFYAQEEVEALKVAFFEVWEVVRDHPLPAATSTKDAAAWRQQTFVEALPQDAFLLANIQHSGEAGCLSPRALAGCRFFAHPCGRPLLPGRRP